MCIRDSNSQGSTSGWLLGSAWGLGVDRLGFRCQGVELGAETPHLSQHVRVLLSDPRGLRADVLVEPCVGKLVGHHCGDRFIGQLAHQVGVEGDGVLAGGACPSPLGLIAFQRECSKPDHAWKRTTPPETDLRLETNRSSGPRDARKGIEKQAAVTKTPETEIRRRYEGCEVLCALVLAFFALLAVHWKFRRRVFLIIRMELKSILHAETGTSAFAILQIDLGLGRFLDEPLELFVEGSLGPPVRFHEHRMFRHRLQPSIPLAPSILVDPLLRVEQVDPLEEGILQNHVAEDGPPLWSHGRLTRPLGTELIDQLRQLGPLHQQGDRIREVVQCLLVGGIPDGQVLAPELEDEDDQRQCKDDCLSQSNQYDRVGDVSCQSAWPQLRLELSII